MGTSQASQTRRPRARRAKAPPEPRGLTPKQVHGGEPPAALGRLIELIEEDGGQVLGSYREPMGGQWQLLAALPIDMVSPTPYQRDLSEGHVKRLTDAIERL
ncbi:MAG: chromosome partitioning protein ParB, partial [Gemmatimonadota bacterium]|nr:chromosome partitioning protein ParB [Gemmatimonadota bacterium]